MLFFQWDLFFRYAALWAQIHEAVDLCVLLLLVMVHLRLSKLERQVEHLAGELEGHIGREGKIVTGA